MTLTILLQEMESHICVPHLYLGMSVEETADTEDGKPKDKTIWVGPPQGSWIKNKVAKKVLQIGNNTRLWQIPYLGNRLLNWSLKVRLEGRDFDVIDEEDDG